MMKSERSPRFDGGKQGNNKKNSGKISKAKVKIFVFSLFFFGLEGYWGQPQGPNFPSP